MRELPLFIPKGASLAATTWVETGFALWKELVPVNRDFFLPRPLNDQEFGLKVATAGDASAMGTALTAFLPIPVKSTEGAQAGTWILGGAPLFPGALAAGWTNHSERATMTSALAAIGVPKDLRNVIGRWPPDGSDDYVQTYRAAVRHLVARFVGVVTAGRSYETFDEEDAYMQVQHRVIEQVGCETAVVAARLEGARGGDFEEDGRCRGPCVPHGDRILVCRNGPGEVEEECGILTKYLIVFNHNRRCARLHLAEGCWRARQRSFADFEYVDEDPPPRTAYNAICRDCWPGRSGDDFVAEENAADMEDSNSSESTTGESS